jgi:hypothetical protein
MMMPPARANGTGPGLPATVTLVPLTEDIWKPGDLSPPPRAGAGARWIKLGGSAKQMTP